MDVTRRFDCPVCLHEALRRARQTHQDIMEVIEAKTEQLLVDIRKFMGRK